ncbi:hypothetical protein, variant [Fonticula alba]|uniref:Uncharacterized protein n=1 Tax=Fonticula alba TaxID=691883 RepID=A0A058ZGM1_FONAL|nr:hypothetical protein, variant [Fonticula alba]KCV72642.1 hypothetical protein, variant [Fonticula alba]|eukprot:XP_009492343.1 hypothetical protein, variant [Fonticula alba]
MEGEHAPLVVPLGLKVEDGQPVAATTPAAEAAAGQESPARASPMGSPAPGPPVPGSPSGSSSPSEQYRCLICNKYLSNDQKLVHHYHHERFTVANALRETLSAPDNNALTPPPAAADPPRRRLRSSFVSSNPSSEAAPAVQSPLSEAELASRAHLAGKVLSNVRTRRAQRNAALGLEGGAFPAICPEVLALQQHQPASGAEPTPKRRRAPVHNSTASSPSSRSGGGVLSGSSAPATPSPVRPEPVPTGDAARRRGASAASSATITYESEFLTTAVRHCPSCNQPFPPEATSFTINDHIDICLETFAAVEAASAAAADAAPPAPTGDPASEMATESPPSPLSPSSSMDVVHIVLPSDRGQQPRFFERMLPPVTTLQTPSAARGQEGSTRSSASAASDCESDVDISLDDTSASPYGPSQYSQMDLVAARAAMRGPSARAGPAGTSQRRGSLLAAMDPTVSSILSDLGGVINDDTFLDAVVASSAVPAVATTPGRRSADESTDNLADQAALAAAAEDARRVGIISSDRVLEAAVRASRTDPPPAGPLGPARSALDLLSVPASGGPAPADLDPTRLLAVVAHLKRHIADLAAAGHSMRHAAAQVTGSSAQVCVCVSAMVCAFVWCHRILLTRSMVYFPQSSPRTRVLAA